MSDSRRSGVASRLPTLVFAAFTAVLIGAAGMMMFSVFMFYDDEGYVLISLRNFAVHGHLYSEVYSQYGPLPYVLYHLLHLLGVPLTHTVGRLLTLAAWAGSAMACATMVWHATRSLAARVAVLSAVFVYLWIMVSEPTHPGGLIALGTALLAYGGHRWIKAGRIQAWAGLAGAGAIALMLTKINIGVFAFLAAIAWFFLHHENATIRRYATPVVLLGVVALPFVLMRPLIAATWVQTYAILFACAGIGAVGAVAMASTPRINWRAFGIGALWAALVGTLVLGAVLLRHTSLHDVLEGVLLRPLRHPVLFNLDFPWVAGVREAAVASAVLFIIAWLCRRRGNARVDEVVGFARIIAAVALAVLIARFPATSPDNLLLAFAVPWLWLFLWPLAGEDDSAIAARSWVGLLFLSQCLHGFPVRGSQIAWGTFLALPLAAIGAWQAAAWLADRFPTARFRARSVRVGLIVAIGVFAVVTTWRLVQVGDRYRIGRNLGLPGAEMVRLPESATALFQLITLNAAAHSDVLFSLPGMFSLNLWSGVPTPTHLNVTHWFSLLEIDQQQEIIRALEAHPRACVVIQREHVNFISKKGFIPKGPLHDFIRDQFAPAFTLDDFEFCVRKGRKIAPLLLGEMFFRQNSLSAEPERPGDTMITFPLILPAGTAVDQVEITSMHTSAPSLRLQGSATRVEVTPVNLRGEPIGPTEVRAWPFALPGPAVISLYFDRNTFPLSPRDTLVVLRDRSGADLGLVRLKP